MKKFLLLICTVFLSFMLFIGCTNTNNIVQKSSIQTENKQEEFDLKQIKELLIEADKCIMSIINFNCTGELLGRYGNIMIYKLNENNPSPDEVMSTLSEFYTEELAKGELSNLAIYCIDDEIGWVPVTYCERCDITKDSQIEMLIDEENKKVVHIEKIHPDYGYPRWYQYTIIKNEEGKWIISDKKEFYPYDNYDNSMLEKSINDWEKVECSSSLEGYESKFIVDKDDNTTWAEGVEGDGVGEWIKLSAGKEIEISSISIRNGYCKNLDLFKKNNRVKNIKVEFSNGDSITQRLDNHLSGDSYITFDKPIKTEYIKFTILDVHNGSQYSDTCISEILVFTKDLK